MGIGFGKLRILLHFFAISPVTGPALATDDESSTVPQEACSMSAREVVDQFIDLFYVQKEVRPAFESWVHPDYIQHKPSLPNGREAVIVFLEKLLKRFPDRTFTIHRVISSDDLVAVHYHSQATPEDPGFAVVDIFRVEDCRMVEHWDVVQSVPEHSENDNTMF
jgi:predicted SnoaL-like aldol condensation-catalyzing enzyme